MRRLLNVRLPLIVLLGLAGTGTLSTGCGDGDLCAILSEVAGTDLCDGEFDDLGDLDDDEDDDFDDDFGDDDEDDDFDDFDDFDDE